MRPRLTEHPPAVTDEPRIASFQELGLPEPLLQALAAVGYESATPIQVETIPRLLKGEDVLGQAQTGTGKTAAFALPVLARIDATQNTTQALVMVPTRELAIQVAEAFQKYASRMPGFHVLPIYGGQSYTPQLKGLKRGAQVIVATPGRVMDHMKRGSLDLSSLRFVVLDEGDEMLQMGFVDDIEWILSQTPAGAPDRLVLGNYAPRHAADRAKTYAQSGRDHHPATNRHHAEDPPALLAGQRPAQA